MTVKKLNKTLILYCFSSVLLLASSPLSQNDNQNENVRSVRRNLFGGQGVDHSVWLDAKLEEASRNFHNRYVPILTNNNANKEK